MTKRDIRQVPVPAIPTVDQAELARRAVLHRYAAGRDTADQTDEALRMLGLHPHGDHADPDLQEWWTGKGWSLAHQLRPTQQPGVHRSLCGQIMSPTRLSHAAHRRCPRCTHRSAKAG